MGLPLWLQEHLETIGAGNPDGVNRKVRAARCAKCHAAILRGLDGDMAALVVETDAQEIGPVGEVLAIAHDRRTYDLAQFGGVWEINPRYDWSIRAGRNFPVVPEHHCGVTYPIPSETHPLLVRASPTVALAPWDDPPF